MSDVEFLIALLAVAVALVRAADLVRVPYPIALVLGGIAIAAVPGLPDLRLEPGVVLVVFLPMLLSAAGFRSSPRELWSEVAPLAWLAIGLVLATMAAVAVVAHALIEGLPWAAAFALGAVVAPTDPVSASATFARLGVPDRVRVIVEGEALVNDAAALVAFRVALAAAVSGSFDAAQAGIDFVGSAAGGVGMGLAVGWTSRQAMRRLTDAPLAILITVLAAYGSFVAAEQLGVSGILAAAVAGAYVGWYAYETMDADTRLSSIAFWQVAVFGLEAMLFILVGVQLPSVIREAETGLALGSLIAYAAAVSAVVVVVRLAWQLVPQALARAVPAAAAADAGDSWAERLVVGWSGMRGAVSLAAVLSIPATVHGGAPFPQRDVIVFITAGVIVVTLVGQGLTLPALMRALGVKGPRAWSPDEATARLETAQAALDRLEELEQEDGIDPELLRRLRELYRARFRQCLIVLGGSEDAPEPDRAPHIHYSDLRRELIGVERATLLSLRNRGRVRLDVLRIIERDLDLEEARLRA